ncbi:ATP-binding protein [Clostridiaceae bacterium 35-E11]
MKKTSSIVFKFLIFFIFVIVIPMIGIMYQIYDYDTNIKYTRMTEDIQHILDSKISLLEFQINQIEFELTSLGHWFKDYYHIYSEEDFQESMDQYYKTDKGIFVRKKYLKTQEGKIILSKSNIFLPEKTNLDNEIKKELLVTEKMEKLFEKVNLKGLGIQWIYIVTPNDLLRIYPYTNVEIFGDDHSFKNDIYYSVASEQKKITWTEPYLDWCGEGWMITCSYPVYIDGHLKAVISADITLDYINNTLTNFKIGNNGFAFLVGQNNNILFHPKYLLYKGEKKGELLNIKDKKGLSDFKKLVDDISSDISKHKKGIKKYKSTLDDEEKLVIFKKFNNIDWTMGIEVNLKDYLVASSTSAAKILNIVGMITILMIIIGLYLFISVSKPLVIFSKFLKNTSLDNMGKFDLIRADNEIGVIITSFNKMIEKIKEYTWDLKRRQNNMEVVFNSVPGILSMITTDYDITLTSTKGTTLFKKYEKNNFLKCHKIFFQKDSPCKGCPVDKVLQTKKLETGRVIDKDKIYAISCNPIIEMGGKIDCLVIYCEDITENILLEQEYVQADKMASIGKAAAGITHELKAPIGIIKGTFYLLNEIVSEQIEDKNTQDEMKEYFEIINNSILHSENIIYDVLDFSMENGKESIINIKKIISQALLFEKDNILRKGIEVNTYYDQEDILIKGNENSLKYVIMNLILNAIQSMENSGKLQISIIKEYIYTDESIHIKIKDTGCGIPEEIADKVFKSFFSTKKDSYGTGLGLWIVKKECDKNNWNIYFESEEGKGTCFHIIINI